MGQRTEGGAGRPGGYSMRPMRTPTAIRAQGRWPALLPMFGVDPKALTGRHAPCPICGGKDRFRFDNKEGRGTWLCSQCGAGDGFDLIGRALGIAFGDIAKRIDDMDPASVPVTAAPTPFDAKKSLDAMHALWRQTVARDYGDPIAAYLSGRGINLQPDQMQVRLTKAARYIEDGEPPTTWPAMVAKVSDRDGRGVNLHRTYLTHAGTKAPVPVPRKVMAGGLPDGCAVRLLPVIGNTLGIAEGIETALSAAQIHSIPVWAALNANRLEVWSPPPGVTRVVIFGDNDENFVGQRASYTLAARLKREHGYTVEVEIPDRAGWDWNDYLLKGA
jgi:putative DNA primase/helicase